VLTAALYGAATAVPLVGGAAVGLRWRIPKPVLAALMAFGAGTMIAAASEELFGPAFSEVGAGLAGLGLIGGAAAYVVLSHLLDTRLGTSAVGLGLLLGAFLDGVPENTALGVSLQEGGLALLVAIAVGNTPEAIASAASLREDPALGPRRGLLLWAGVGVLLTLVTVGAHAGSDVVSPAAIAVAQAVAGGATLAVLADTLLPEAYRDGGWWIGLSTALGFWLAFVLG
jgi:ZIP family zinc transporter